MLSLVQINVARSQLALLQLALSTVDDFTPPESVAVAAKVGIEQAKKHSYPVPPLAKVLAEEGKPLTKAQFKQLQEYFEENSWTGPVELIFNEEGTERLEPPSREFVEYLCWGSAGAEAWVRRIPASNQ
jgi:hypothetical protein